MEFLKQSTSVTLLIGPFLDDTTGKDAETGLTISQADVRLSKNGGNMAQKNEATSCTHDELGYYTCPLDTTDTNTLGILKVMVHETGALPVWHSYQVVTANVYDTLCSTDQLDVNVTNVAGTSQTGNDNGADINTILSRIVGTIASGTHNPQSGDAYARLGAPAGASIAADLVTIDNFVDELESRLTAARAGYLDNLNIAENVAGVSDISGLNDPTAAAIADAVWDEAISGHTGAGSFGEQCGTDIDAILADTGTDGVVVAAASKTGYALSAAGIDAIWDDTEALTGDSLSYETMISRLYSHMNNEMNITDATGAVALRNAADTADMASCTVTDDSTTTQRTELAWV